MPQAKLGARCAIVKRKGYCERILHFDLTTLKLFLAVVEERAMAKAAEREHISPPAISKRISELESALGVVLLERQSTGIRPTAAGHALAIEARSVLHSLDHLQCKLGEFASGQRGQVKVVSNPSGLVGPLPEHLKSFMLTHPLVSVRLDERHSNEVVHAVADGDADIGIFAHHIGAEGLTITPYHAVRLVLVTPKGHPLAKKRKASFVNAVDHAFVGLTEISAVGALVLKVAAAQGLNLKCTLHVTGFEALRRMVQAGLGIGVIPEFCARPYTRVMNLSCVPLVDSWSEYKLDICTREPETLSMSARHLLKHLTRPSESSG